MFLFYCNVCDQLFVVVVVVVVDDDDDDNDDDKEEEDDICICLKVCQLFS